MPAYAEKRVRVVFAPLSRRYRGVIAAAAGLARQDDRRDAT